MSIKITETQKLLSMSREPDKMVPSYLDDELMLVDNINLLGMPGAIRSNINIIAICKKGKMYMEVNGNPVEVHANQIFVCPPETSLGELMFSADFEYTALCITNRVLQHYLHSFVNVWNESTYIQKIRVVNIEGEEIIFIDKVYDLLRLLLEFTDDNLDKAYIEEMLNGILSASLIGFCSLLQKQTPQISTQLKQNLSLFNRFLGLLQSSEIKHRTVAYYASELFISSKYLTVICKKNSGKTANEWIQEYTLSDITYYLQNTDLSVKEISNKLGFPNTSFFGKYIKEHLGCTPLEYRAQKVVK